jgi:hypothetical protein
LDEEFVVEEILSVEEELKSYVEFSAEFSV